MEWLSGLLAPLVKPVAEAATKITATTQDYLWKQALLGAITKNISLLALLLTMICALVALAMGAYLANGFIQTCRDAMRDNEIKKSEWALIGMQAVIILPSIASLTGFGVAVFITLILHKG